MPATIVMPADAPRIKTQATRAYGATVVPYDRRREKREEIAARIANEQGAVVVPSFDDPHIVAGQGTAGLEIAAQAAALGVALDAVLVPCSGGGLSSGIALALSGASPETRLIIAEPEGYDGARLSLEAGTRNAAAGTRDTIADALTSPGVGAIPFAILKSRGAHGIAVNDDALMRAVGLCALKLKLVVEPGGAAALAAALSSAFDAQGKAAAIVLSGGNIDPEMLTRCINSVAGTD
jgi:threonine dehydratase